MKAIILAGGIGTRLKKIIKDVPKPMALIGEKPFLEYLILQLKKWSIKEIVLSVGYKNEKIIDYFGNGDKWGVKIIYCREELPLGTGGALRESSRIIKDKNFIVMNGDSFLVIDLNKLISYHKHKKAIATIATVHVDNTNRYGRIEINENGEIIKFIEKGYSGKGFINSGIYIINRELINNIPEGAISLENGILPMLINHGLYGIKIKKFFMDIGIPEDYLKLKKKPDKLISKIQGI
ncbi:nucleotidyltransferase family protein [Candidatus Desantisbacteria bacterium]|nr:nucleotidyltransferase family protein [Candidatus Desantisbacteria bacterium]